MRLCHKERARCRSVAAEPAGPAGTITGYTVLTAGEYGDVLACLLTVNVWLDVG